MWSKILRTRCAIFVGVLFVTIPIRADAQATSPDAARRFIESFGNQTVDVVTSPRSAVDRRSAFTRIMLGAIDFKAVGAIALGKLGRQATAQQKREFMPLFAAYAIDVAMEKFGSLQQISFGLGGATPQPNGDVKVYTRISTGEQPMQVYWRVRSTPAGPRINDIEVDGTSLAVYYRGEFERAGVANVPQLIARLKEMTKSSYTVTITQQALR